MLDGFPLWSVAQYKSSVGSACSGIRELCLLSLHLLHLAPYVLFLNMPLILRFGGYGHWLSPGFKEQFVV